LTPARTMLSVTCELAENVIGVAFRGLDLAGHVAEQAGFEAGADRPARLYLQHAERRVEREGVAVGVEADARKGDGGPDRADREAAGGVSDDIGRDGAAEAPAQRAE